jgi:hypothetical protein
MSKDNPEKGDLFYLDGDPVLLIEDEGILRNIILSGSCKSGLIKGERLLNIIKKDNYIGSIYTFIDLLSEKIEDCKMMQTVPPLDYGQIWFSHTSDDLILLYQDRDEYDPVLRNVRFKRTVGTVGACKGASEHEMYLKDQSYICNIAVLADELMSVQGRPFRPFV